MSKVVFVGNVPYTMGEDQLIEVFRTVGQVVGLRLVFDRDTGKPKGYGFCEFADHETAASAVRNLNNHEIGGRSLRIDLADSDPFLEGKTTVRGELVDDEKTDGPNAFLSSIPTGVPVPPGSNALDMISQTLADMAPSQLMEVLAQMKAFVITYPDAARALLVAHPQLAYALFQALLLNNIVDPTILERMLAATSHGQARAPPPPQISQPTPTPAAYAAPPFPATSAPPASSTPVSYGYPSTAAAVPPQPYYQPPPAIPQISTPQPQVAALGNEEQQRMLQQVLSMSPEEIGQLPPATRDSVLQLRAQLMGSMPGGP